MFLWLCAATETKGKEGWTMIKSFRFLLQFAWINLGAILAFALIVIAGAWCTGVPQGNQNLFATYFSTFPLLSLIVLFIYSFGLTTSNLNLALSFGARRRDFFFAVQGILLLYTGVCWMLQVVMSSIPFLFHWTDQERWQVLLSLGGFSSWAYPLVCLAILCLGGLCGMLMVRSKLLGTLVLILALVAAIAATALLFITADMFASGAGWGALPLILVAAMAGIVGASEYFFWRTMRRHIVR